MGKIQIYIFVIYQVEFLYHISNHQNIWSLDKVLPNNNIIRGMSFKFNLLLHSLL